MQLSTEQLKYMGRGKSKSTRELEQEILKMQIKSEMIEEMDDIINDKLKDMIGPAVAESIGKIHNFPLTVKQFSSLTGWKDSKIYKMCQRGQIPHTKEGSKIYINLKDVNYQLLSLEWPE